MTARHAGAGRIADTALIDQVRACARDIRAWGAEPTPIVDADSLDQAVDLMNRDHLAVCRLLGRAFALLEQIGEMGE